jgi:hypothetical protein
MGKCPSSIQILSPNNGSFTCKARFMEIEVTSLFLRVILLYSFGSK